MKRTAQASQIVVVNHHLFFADVALRDEGISELLPSCNTVIFDEAHLIEETATRYFGRQLSSFRFADLASDAAAFLEGKERGARGGFARESDLEADRSAGRRPVFFLQRRTRGGMRHYFTLPQPCERFPARPQLASRAKYRAPAAQYRETRAENWCRF